MTKDKITSLVRTTIDGHGDYNFDNSIKIWRLYQCFI